MKTAGQKTSASLHAAGQQLNYKKVGTKLPYGNVAWSWKGLHEASLTTKATSFPRPYSQENLVPVVDRNKTILAKVSKKNGNAQRIPKLTPI